MFVVETDLVVRYAETDQMGIAHHSNYPVWFEAGRTDFIKKAGLPYSKIEESGFMLPLIELNCTFKGSAKYEDELIIKTSIKEFSCTRITFNYEVYRKGESALISRGETMHAWTNRGLRPVNIKKHASHIYDLLSSAV